ncbi:MAG: aminotransferase class I and II [Candidatus Azobacteroides sp.]|nr:aminotransferase class I and II [Candidatus Azobacteroides sp.]
MDIRKVYATRYILPLREGGSLPALVEADDGFKYVVKFRGAGHGTKALIADFIGGVMAKVLHLQVPELVFIDIDESFGRTEGDEEIQDLLKSSLGNNLGFHFLSGALAFDPLVNRIDPETASKIVWLDAYLTNIDRTIKNTNMLIWHKELWLIDFGASLYFHHGWVNWEKHIRGTFPQVKDHVLLPYATKLPEMDNVCKRLITDELIEEIIYTIPNDWLTWKENQETVEEIRQIYICFLKERRDHSELFIKEAQHARNALI